MSGRASFTLLLAIPAVLLCAAIAVSIPVGRHSDEFILLAPWSARAVHLVSLLVFLFAGGLYVASLTRRFNGARRWVAVGWSLAVLLPAGCAFGGLSMLGVVGLPLGPRVESCGRLFRLQVVPGIGSREELYLLEEVDSGPVYWRGRVRASPGTWTTFAVLPRGLDTGGKSYWLLLAADGRRVVCLFQNVVLFTWDPEREEVGGDPFCMLGPDDEPDDHRDVRHAEWLTAEHLKRGAEHPNPWARGVTLYVLDARPELRAGLEDVHRRLQADPAAVADADPR